MRKLSKRRKEQQKKQQLRGQDDLFCLSTPPEAARLHYQGNTLKTKHSSIPCTSSRDRGVKAALPLAMMQLFCSLCCYLSLFVSSPDSFSLIRNFTMFSLVKKKKKKKEKRKERSSHPYSAVMFFSLIQFEATPTGTLSCFFMLSWHLSYSKSTLKFVAQKKEKKRSYICPH